ncbi:MAG: bifunctional UDP-N-acetylglucosamine diphosphorylase/glucosamine-1-phosphate N-acetyltransferase GlmU [Clostridia bacterium]|jgi:bifunctional UDP-N-acetylglucosamine pyrophosphorylase/glucosamine-1-phosphate N-acetyltransferase|nr:bifunctional UDP-N-acetylglucosamine diphosphorylase/glucosamine-1-phosphate N-acetyltransferase GlmU [Clostridia bacterium]
MKNTAAIILAAGKGTRMKSHLPKVLHKVAGKTMAEQVLSQVHSAGIGKCYMVIGHSSREVQDTLGDIAEYVVQRPQLGTGHAVIQAIPFLSMETRAVLVACADTPLLTAKTLKALMEEFKQGKAACTVLTAKTENPHGYGRIIRNAEGFVTGIVEEKDATEAEKQICEVNTGTYFFDWRLLQEVLCELTNDNAQCEYYLTDTVKVLVEHGHKVTACLAADFQETMGVNDKVQLAMAEQVLRKRKITELQLAGVTVQDPANTYIDTEVEVGADTVIYAGCHLRGNTVIGKNCEIGPDSQITDTKVGDKCTILRSVTNDVVIGNAANIGPFAYLRPGTVLAENVKVGDFVELKKSHIGAGSKIPHLSYVGDSVVGSKVNIGCGTITCNYDGFNKFQTIIEDGAFIGSNSNLVAPVKIGANAYVAAGSTITMEVSADDLAIARGKQRNLEGRGKELREKLKNNK